ncbi:MAG: ATP-dependent DNA helicase RecG [Rickettsiaceae bacterium]|nr:MAG: ATP-dependent DNA helicase RecG [Rickettsiaceae bacterium]
MLNILFKSIHETFRLKAKTQEALRRIGLNNLRDLLFYKPHSYLSKDINPNLSKVYDGQLIQTCITIDRIQLSNNKKAPTRIWVSNPSGSLLLIFFNQIPNFIISRLKVGTTHIIVGKTQLSEHYWQITHPDFIFDKNLSSSVFEPLYSLTYGLTNKQLYSYIIRGLDTLRNEIDKQQFKQLETNYLQELMSDLANIHLYKINLLNQQIATIWETSLRKLATKELLSGQLLLKVSRNRRKNKQGISCTKDHQLQSSILKKLKFELTPAQNSVIEEIEADQCLAIQMTRLLQGDVGSGKTLVAILTMINVVKYGRQAVLMAPTDLLASQHFEFFKHALQETKINIALLTGKTSPKLRKTLYEDIANGNILLLIGTHALFQSKVVFNDLSYVVIDEQHKFGVEQRLQLITKSLNPDVLIMTATPIPRSLCLTIFGDMSVSKLTSKPANRLPIITTSISADRTKDIILSLNKIVSAQEKIYWICPLVDQGEDISIDYKDHNLMDTQYRYRVIKEIYGDNVGIVHGKMTSEQKDDVMQKFKFGDIHILVATTVIEVGIDVPEATLIVIENAEVFGLAQLHQLRGRVGRGRKQSYCVMIYNHLKISKVGRKRLDIMRKTNDGFYIAEQDMILRGSGEIVGKRQSGEPCFFFANLSKDLENLEWASNNAQVIEQSEFIDFQINLFVKGTQQSLEN